MRRCLSSGALALPVASPAHPQPLEQSPGHRRAVAAMNIAVCVKYVPDATGDRHFEADKTVDRVGVDGLLSELDEYAVEQALQIKEKAENPEDVTVTAVCVGPEQAVDAVRKALQMGVDQGVHVSDEAIAGSDSIATSLVLAKAIQKGTEKGSYDLVMCGMASTDGTMSVVPA